MGLPIPITSKSINHGQLLPWAAALELWDPSHGVAMEGRWAEVAQGPNQTLGLVVIMGVSMEIEEILGQLSHDIPLIWENVMDISWENLGKSMNMGYRNGI